MELAFLFFSFSLLYFYIGGLSAKIATSRLNNGIQICWASLWAVSSIG
jgi:hypothetical protein